MGRLLNRLERLDRDLQSRPPHPLMGTASLHASIINGGHELSSYPDRCRLQMERRTVAGETARSAVAEIESILTELRDDDPEFEAAGRLMFARPPYELPPGSDLAARLTHAAASAATRPKSSIPGKRSALQFL